MASSESGGGSKLLGNISQHLYLRRWWQRLREELPQWVMAGIGGLLIGGYVIMVAYIPEKWAVLSLVAVAGFFVLVIVGNLRMALLATLLLDIPLQVDANFQFVQTLDKVPFVNGYNVSVTSGVLVLLYLIWIAEIVTKRERLPVRPSKAIIPLLVYLGFAALSMFVAPHFEYSTMELFLLFQMFLVYVYVVGTVRTESEIQIITVFLLIGLILESLVMIAVRLRGEGLNLPFLLVRIDESMRVGGTVGSPNGAGGYLAMALSISLGAIFADTNRWPRLLPVTALGLGLVALLFTGSRGAWLGLFVAIVAIYLQLGNRVKRSVVPLLTVPSVFLIILILFKDTLLLRFLGDDGGSAAARWPLIQLAFLMVKRNPVLGVGLNNFIFAAPDYLTFQISQSWFSTVHNKYLLVWSEIGTGGLIAFIWFLVATLYRGWQIRKVDHPQFSPLAAGYTAAVVAAMVHMLVEIYQGRAQIQMLWLIAAVVAVLNVMLIPDSPQHPGAERYGGI